MKFISPKSRQTPYCENSAMSSSLFEVLDGERESLAEPVVVKRLEAALRRLTPWINEDNVKKAVRAITHASATGLIEANEAVHAARIRFRDERFDLSGCRAKVLR